MSNIDQALETQKKNIEATTGKSVQQLIAMVHQSGLSKHTDVIAMLKTTLELGHGNANLIAHLAKQARAPIADVATDPLDALYVGGKSALRPIHLKLLDILNSLGEFESAPKQKYISYRRKKQFAMIGPATNSRIDLGLNVKGLPDDDRLQVMPAGKMCQYQVKLTTLDDVDEKIENWLKAAFNSAG